jgi:hypothetical protein
MDPGLRRDDSEKIEGLSLATGLSVTSLFRGEGTGGIIRARNRGRETRESLRITTPP